MHHIGNDEQLFVDNHLIDSVQCVTRQVVQPTKSEANPLILKDKPWETMLFFTCNTWNVHHIDGRFQCWYEDRAIDYEAWREIEKRTILTPRSKQPVQSRLHPAVSAIRTLYAESEDGLLWNKVCGDFDLGVPGTNAVVGNSTFGNIHAPCVFADPRETDPAKRYKMIFTHLDWEERSSHGRITLAHSPDGKNWHVAPESPRFGASGPRLGDVWTSFYDTDSQRYVLATRHIDMHRHGRAGTKEHTPVLPGAFGPYYPGDPQRMNKRRVSLSMSKDLIEWNEPEEIVVPDDSIDNLDDSFYGMHVTKIGGLYLGFLHRLKHVENTMEIVLAYSRDLTNWERVVPDTPFIPVGPAGAWDQGMVTMPNPPTLRDDETWLFYGGCHNHHDWWVEGRSQKERLPVPESWNKNHVAFGLGLATMKRNRYVALSAGPRDGLVVTELVSSDGRELRINGRCKPGGFIRVGVSQRGGFGLQECDAFVGDDADHRVTWRGKTFGPMTGPCRLFFQLRNAELFGFHVTG